MANAGLKLHSGHLDLSNALAAIMATNLGNVRVGIFLGIRLNANLRPITFTDDGADDLKLPIEVDAIPPLVGSPALTRAALMEIGLHERFSKEIALSA